MRIEDIEDSLRRLGEGVWCTSHSFFLAIFLYKLYRRWRIAHEEVPTTQLLLGMSATQKLQGTDSNKLTIYKD